MKEIRFAIIGCGLMGREFASAAARWMHLSGMTARPKIVPLSQANICASARHIGATLALFVGLRGLWRQFRRHRP